MQIPHKAAYRFLKVPILNSSLAPKQVRLSSTQLLVYAMLLHRERKVPEGVLKKCRIAKWLNIQPKTAGSALEHLRKLSLAERNDRGWRAKLPSDDQQKWFMMLKTPADPGSFIDRCAYDTVLIVSPEGRDAGLSLSANHLYWRLNTNAALVPGGGGSGVIAKGHGSVWETVNKHFLANAMHTTRKTVLTNLQKLTKLGLIRLTPVPEQPTRFFVHVLSRTQSQLVFWSTRDSIKSREIAIPSLKYITDAPVVASHAAEPDPWAPYVKVLVAYGIPGSLHDQILDAVDELNMGCSQFEQLVCKVNRDHQHNRRSRGFGTDHCGHLLQYELNERIAQQNARSTLRTTYSPPPWNQDRDRAKRSLLNTLQLGTKDADLVLWIAEQDGLRLGDGGMLPIRITYEEITMLVNTCEGNLDRFKVSLLATLHDETPSPGYCPVLDKLQQLEQVPRPDLSSLRMCLKNPVEKEQDVWMHVEAHFRHELTSEREIRLNTQRLVDKVTAECLSKGGRVDAAHFQHLVDQHLDKSLVPDDIVL